MTTPIDNKILNYGEMLETNPLEKVAAFQNMLCNACQLQNAGECIKEHGECPVDTVGRAYKRAS
jgi:hypothetical protein